MYLNSHFAITTVALAWIYLRRNESLLLRAQHVHGCDGDRAGLLHGVPDRAAALHARVGLRRLGRAASPASRRRAPRRTLLYNPFAAVPSMHVAFALMLGFSMIGMIRRRWAQACGPAIRCWSRSSSSRPPTTGGSTRSSARYGRASPRGPRARCWRAPGRSVGLRPLGPAEAASRPRLHPIVTSPHRAAARPPHHRARVPGARHATGSSSRG